MRNKFSSIRIAKQPMVVDADGLNILAGKMETLKKAGGPRLLTPHPGEMKRLFPEEKCRAGDGDKVLREICGDTSLERQPHDCRGKRDAR